MPSPDRQPPANTLRRDVLQKVCPPLPAPFAGILLARGGEGTEKTLRPSRLSNTRVDPTRAFRPGGITGKRPVGAVPTSGGPLRFEICHEKIPILKRTYKDSRNGMEPLGPTPFPDPARRTGSTRHNWTKKAVRKAAGCAFRNKMHVLTGVRGDRAWRRRFPPAEAATTAGGETIAP